MSVALLTEVFQKRYVYYLICILTTHTMKDIPIIRKNQSGFSDAEAESTYIQKYIHT
jgi:hypothetical protein